MSRAPAPPDLRSRAGTTLIELLVVLAIASVMLAVSTVALSTLAGRGEGVEERLAALLADARAMAARHGTPMRLRLLPDDRYQVVDLASLVVVEEGELRSDDLAPLPAAFTVYPQGTARAGSLCARIAGEWRMLTMDPVIATLRLTPSAEPCPTR